MPKRTDTVCSRINTLACSGCYIAAIDATSCTSHPIGSRTFKVVAGAVGAPTRVGFLEPSVKAIEFAVSTTQHKLSTSRGAQP